MPLISGSCHRVPCALESSGGLARYDAAGLLFVPSFTDAPGFLADFN